MIIKAIKTAKDKGNKNLNRSVIKNIIEYIANYINDEDKQATVHYRHNTKGITIDEIMNEIIANYEKCNSRKNGKLYHHEVMAFNPDDKEFLSDEKLRIIAREYCRIRAKNSLGYANVHRDKEHVHLHFFFSANLINSNKRLRLSKAEFAKMQSDFEYYINTTFPELTPSYFYQHEKSRIKEYISKIIDKSNNINEFMDNLKNIGLGYYKYDNEIRGIIYNGLMYKFDSLNLNEKITNIESDKKGLLDWIKKGVIDTLYEAGEALILGEHSQPNKETKERINVLDGADNIFKDIFHEAGQAIILGEHDKQKKQFEKVFSSKENINKESKKVFNDYYQERLAKAESKNQSKEEDTPEL